MPLGLIDSHCHLNHEYIAAAGSAGDIMARARHAGVAGALTICCRITQDLPQILDIARAQENVWCTIGTHPHDAGLDAEKDVTEAAIVQAIKDNPSIIGVGETGLDYYYNNSSREDQHASFRKHVRAAAASGLPLIIHTRDADDDTIRILREEGAGTDPRVRGVMHCFSGSRDLAMQSLEIGFYISFSGILTFKKAQELRDIARDVPMDRILVETDAPYLAPEPLRGKTNEPAFIMHTLRKIAEIKGLDEQGAITICNKNFFELFNRAVPV